MISTAETWVSCTFSQSGLDGASSLVKEDHPELSFVQCIVLAMALNWVHLVILGATRGCVLYEINALILGEVGIDSVGGDSRCKTRDRVVGCHDGGEFYPIGHVLEEKDICSYMKEEKICSDSGFFNWQAAATVVPTPPLISCTDPFLETSFGCMLYDDECWVNAAQQEKICMILGGTMASANTHADFVTFVNYLMDDFFLEDDVFSPSVGYDEGAGAWLWKNNGRVTESNEWSVFPSDSVGCVDMAIWRDYKLFLDSECGNTILLCKAYFA